MSQPPTSDDPFLHDGGLMGELMRGFDWTRNPLGGPSSWPQSLKTAVSLMLRARQPVFIGWGPRLVSLYNDGYIPICGDKHPRALGRPMSEVWSEIWSTLEPINQAVLRGESQWFENMAFELAGRSEPGTSYFSFSYTPLLDDDGRIGGIFCSAIETTSTMRLAQRRSDETSRLQRLFEQAPGFIFTLRGPEHVFEFINDAHRRLFRRPGIVGMPVREAFPDLAGQGIYELLDEVYRTGERRVQRAVKTLLRDEPHGLPREFVLDFVFAPVFDDAGRVSGIFCEGNDVSGLHVAQQALVEKEEQLRLATDAAEIAFWDVNPATGSLFWPPRARAMFGVTTQEPVTLDDFFPRLHPEDLDAVSAAFAAACDPAQRALYDVEFRTIGRDDGVLRWVAAKGRGLFDGDGRCVRVIGTTIDITARKAAEQAMEVALAASRTGTFHWDIQDNKLSWDSALDKLFGLRPGQAVRSLEQFIALVHPDDRAGVIERCERCRDEAADFEMEFRVVAPDGSVRWLYDRGRTLVDATGRAKTMTGACVDVTERRQAEAAVRASEAFLRRTLESVPGITFTADADGACDYLSRQWTEYTGVGVPEQASHWLSALHPDDRARASSAWNTAVRERTPFSIECRIRRHDGAYEWFKAEARIIPGDRDVPERWIGSLHNVHDLKQTQAALQEREREMRSLADNSPDIIARFDRQLRHVFVNAAVERVTGVPMAAFVGRTNEELGLPAALCEPANRALRRVFQERRPVSAQFEFEHDGATRHLACRLVPEPGEDGAVEHVLCVSRDITDLWQAQEALRRADRQKDDFLATLAHELRNPLAPLRTGLQVLQRGSGSPQEQRVRQIMERQLNHMVRLVDELLDIARISQGKIVLQRETLQLQAILEHAVEACRPLLETHGHALEWSGADPSWHVHGDVTRLVQVVSNLLNNAAKYTPAGGRIALRARAEGDNLLLEVEDNGVGIPHEQLDRVFERFVQVDQHLERSQGGLGIGLSVVKSLVEMHGGKVSADSAGPGFGSRFQVSLPRVQQRAAAADNGLTGLKALLPIPRRQVLIVDDNQDAAATLAMIVEIGGHDARIAHDGETALQMVAAQQPAIVFMDIGMPGLNGYETAARLRTLPGGRYPLLVALTGWATEADQARSLAAGFDVHLTKPVEIAEVERLLRGEERVPVEPQPSTASR